MLSLDFTPALASLPELLSGAWVTIKVTFFALAISCCLGTLIGLGRISSRHNEVW